MFFLACEGEGSSYSLTQIEEKTYMLSVAACNLEGNIDDPDGFLTEYFCLKLDFFPFKRYSSEELSPFQSNTDEKWPFSAATCNLEGNPGLKYILSCL